MHQPPPYGPRTYPRAERLSWQFFISPTLISNGNGVSHQVPADTNFDGLFLGRSRPFAPSKIRCKHLPESVRIAHTLQSRRVRVAFLPSLMATMASPRPRHSGDLDAPPTLMGMMMSCNDLPSTLTSSSSPSSPKPPKAAPAVTVTVTPITPPRSKPPRPASTWHSDADADADTSDSIASTAVDAPSTPIASRTAPNTPNAPHTHRDREREPLGSDTKQSQSSTLTEDFIQVSHPTSPDRSHSPDRSPPSSPPQGQRERGRLGHIVSISGIKRSLSQTDLRLGARRPSRIKAAVSRLSRNWTQHFGEGEGGRGGEEKRKGS
ncbi:hypothetical protein B0T16DRAFT_450612 [Cercophora newfieldiana]|uniref:Uncharacterized protein n=1 Tax=Cercophora newfieldiana TaxID=92897 RepID=A0AA39YLL9_9PEZI|nr:hypothetical protein B0T16DRAFT_450612 [Cercophora newfieldiana]